MKQRNGLPHRGNKSYSYSYHGECITGRGTGHIDDEEQLSAGVEQNETTGAGGDEGDAFLCVSISLERGISATTFTFDLKR